MPMDSGLKQRLVGAAVLVALAVIFLPMLVKGPAPDSGVSDLPFTMPDAPGGDYATRDLPLATPGAETVPALRDDALPTVDTATAPASEALPLPAAAVSAPMAALPAPAAASARLPATTAGGNYAVSFGAYGSSGNAETVVARLRAAGLPGYREAAMVNGKHAWRVRIGPYATRAEAEAARIAATDVRDDLGARVVALDADVAAAPSVTAETKPAASAPLPAAAADIGFAVQVGAFSRPADAIALRDRIRAAGFNALIESVETDKGALTRVKAGPVVSRADADQLKAQLAARLGLDGIVRSHP